MRNFNGSRHGKQFTLRHRRVGFGRREKLVFAKVGEE
jgi:hypothetical protein